MSRPVKHKIIDILLQAILMVTLVVPVTPSIAAMPAGNNPTHSSGYCDMEMPPSSPGHQAISPDSNEFMTCEHACCPDGICDCLNGCMSISSLNNAPLPSDEVLISYSQNINSAPVLSDQHTINNCYLPNLQPPIS